MCREANANSTSLAPSLLATASAPALRPLPSPSKLAGSERSEDGTHKLKMVPDHPQRLLEAAPGAEEEDPIGADGGKMTGEFKLITR
jgi:hypothetical protein